MRFKNARAIGRMRDAGRLVAECFALLEENIKPGIPLSVLDQIVEDYIVRNGAEPLYKGYQGSSAEHPPFPALYVHLLTMKYVMACQMGVFLKRVILSELTSA